MEKLTGNVLLGGVDSILIVRMEHLKLNILDTTILDPAGDQCRETTPRYLLSKDSASI